MKRSRFTEEQIIGILKESDAGRKTDELCRQHGISKGTFYEWRKKYHGLSVCDAKRLRALEEENRRLNVCLQHKPAQGGQQAGIAGKAKPPSVAVRSAVICRAEAIQPL